MKNAPFQVNINVLNTLLRLMLLLIILLIVAICGIYQIEPFRLPRRCV